MKRIMRAFKIHEVSAVDRPAQAGARALIMKRDDGVDKRDFSAARRKKDAKSGAAMKDGSFPIENAGDLKNAMRLAGHAKNPSAARAHIRSRAKALGLSGQLSDAYKNEGGGMFSNLFNLFKGFTGSTDTLSESIKSILEDDKATDKAALIDETIKQFSDHVTDEFGKTLSEGNSDSANDEDHMSAALKKALGLADTASEEEVLAALEVLKAAAEKPKRTDGKGDDGDGDEEDGKDGKKKTMKADDLPADVRKALADLEDLKKRNAVLEQERELNLFRKRAVEIGAPEAKAEVLMKAYAGDKPSLDEVFAMLKAAYAAVDASDGLREIGSTRSDTGDEMDALKAKAAELRKANPKLTEEGAFAKAYADPANRKLVQEERRKNRPQAA